MAKKAPQKKAAPKAAAKKTPAKALPAKKAVAPVTKTVTVVTTTKQAHDPHHDSLGASLKAHRREWGQYTLGIIALVIGAYLVLNVAVGVILLVIGAMLLSDKIKSSKTIEEIIDEDE